MTEEDEAFEAIDKAQGWRKRQIEQQLGQPIYFKPRKEWVGLTEDEIDYYIVHRLGNASKKNLVNLIRQMEEKLKEKNHV